MQHFLTGGGTLTYIFSLVCECEFKFENIKFVLLGCCFDSTHAIFWLLKKYF